MLSGGSRKRKGSRREREIKKLLESQGYYVTKAGGSLGAFDLIAIKEGESRFIQVKSNRLPPLSERKILQDLALQIAAPWRKIEVHVIKDYAGTEIYDVTANGLHRRGSDAN